MKITNSFFNDIFNVKLGLHKYFYGIFQGF